MISITGLVLQWYRPKEEGTEETHCNQQVLNSIILEHLLA